MSVPLDKQIDALSSRLTEARAHLLDALREFIELGEEAERVFKLLVARSPRSAAGDVVQMMLELRTTNDGLRRFAESLAEAGQAKP